MQRIQYVDLRTDYAHGLEALLKALMAETPSFAREEASRLEEAEAARLKAQRETEAKRARTEAEARAKAEEELRAQQEAERARQEAEAVFQTMTTATVAIEKRASAALLVFGYVVALLGGLWSIPIGVILRRKAKRADGQETYVYDMESRRHGAIMIRIGIAIMILMSIVVLMLGIVAR